MDKAVILYHSRTGITKRYAAAIGEYLQSKGLPVSLASIQEYQPALIEGARYVLLGCWTSGLMVILQHPDRPWVTFARLLPPMPDAKVALFTTYKILTGSMFNNMFRQLDGKLPLPALELKSRSGALSAADKAALDDFID